MLVQVKAKHIRAGERSRPCSCAIALAVRETMNLDLDTTVRVSVSDKVRIRRIADGELLQLFKLSKAAHDFMSKFDRGPRSAVKPATFRLQEVKL